MRFVNKSVINLRSANRKTSRIFLVIAVVCLTAVNASSSQETKCIEKVEEMLQDHHGTLYTDLSNSTDPEKLKVLKQHFTENKCVSYEICNHQDKTTDPKKLKQKLKPYVVGLIRAHDKFKAEAGQSNIRDEIDEAIYETIKNHLLEKKSFSNTKADCVVAFIMTTGAVEKAFTTELFFNSEKLEEVVRPSIDEYESSVASQTPEEQTKGFWGRHFGWIPNIFS